jgi:hypothetical protein
MWSGRASADNSLTSKSCTLAGNILSEIVVGDAAQGLTL